MYRYYEALSDWYSKAPLDICLFVEGKPITIRSFIETVDKKAKGFKKLVTRFSCNGILRKPTNKYDDVVDFFAACKNNLSFGFVPEDCTIEDMKKAFDKMYQPFGPVLLINDFENEILSYHEAISDSGHYCFSSGSGQYRTMIARTADSWIDNFEVQNRLFSIDEANAVGVLGSIAYSGNLNIVLGALFHQCTVSFISSIDHATPKVDVLYLVPTVLKGLLKKRRNYLMNVGTILTAGERLSGQTVDDLYALNPEVKLVDFYGSVEVSYVSYRDFSSRSYSSKSVGELFPNVKVTINGDVISVRSPFVSKSSFLSVPTSDRGYFKKDELVLLGREEHVVSMSGKMIDLYEVEECLHNVDGVIDAFAVAIDDPNRGSTFGIIINGNVDQKKIRRAVRNYGVPKKLVYTNDIPRLPSGKVDRGKLRQLIET